MNEQRPKTTTKRGVMIITSNLKGVMIDVKPKAATKRGGEYIIMIYTTEVCSRHECHIRQLRVLRHKYHT